MVDKSNAFRMDPDVPLVVPEINPHAARTHRGHPRLPELHHDRHRDAAQAAARRRPAAARRRHQLPGGVGRRASTASRTCASRRWRGRAARRITPRHFAAPDRLQPDPAHRHVRRRRLHRRGAEARQRDAQDPRGARSRRSRPPPCGCRSSPATPWRSTPRPRSTISAGEARASSSSGSPGSGSGTIRPQERYPMPVHRRGPGRLLRGAHSRRSLASARAELLGGGRSAPQGRRDERGADRGAAAPVLSAGTGGWRGRCPSGAAVLASASASGPLHLAVLLTIVVVTYARRARRAALESVGGYKPGHYEPKDLQARRMAPAASTARPLFSRDPLARWFSTSCSVLLVVVVWLTLMPMPGPARRPRLAAERAVAPTGWCSRTTGPAIQGWQVQPEAADGAGHAAVAARGCFSGTTCA